MGKKHKKLQKAEQRSNSWSLSDPTILGLLGGYGPTRSGVTVTEETALRNAAVWRAVNGTASTVAALPIKLFRDRPSGLRETVDKKEFPAFTDPMYPEITWYEGVETLVASVLVYGDGFALKIWNEAGTRVLRVLPLDPATVSVSRVDPTEDNPSGKLYKLNGLDTPLTPFEVMQIPGLSYDGLCGLSPVRQNREAIGAAIAAAEVGAKMFDSGLLTGGFLQAEGEINDEQADQARRRWKERTAGVVRSYEVAMLSHGWKFVPNQIPPEDAQWLEARKFSVEEIARIFGMPPALLFEYGATGNIEADKLGAQWLRFSLNALLKRVEDRLSLHLLPEDVFCEFVREGLLQGTPKEQAEVTAIEIQSGVLSVDEARELKNRPPSDGAVDAALVNAVGVLVRSGYDPASVLEALGLPPMKHLGLLPVTLQKEEVFEAEADAAAAEPEQDEDGSGDESFSDSEGDASEGE